MKNSSQEQRLINHYEGRLWALKGLFGFPVLSQNSKSAFENVIPFFESRQQEKLLGTLRAEASFSLCELSCEKYSLQTTVQSSIVYARNSSRDSQAKLIVTFVVKWREFHGNKKIATTLICYARHVMLQTGQQQEKTRVFKIYSSRFLDITYLNGCEQRLLFARQLTQRKCSLCLQGNCWEAQIYLSSEVGLKNMLLHPFCLEKPDSQSN